MDRTIYIHAGVPKTGSTAIQTFLLENRQMLGERGLFLPVTGTVQHAHNHRSLANAFSPRGHVPGMVSKLADEVEAAGRPERVLLTAENFSLNFVKPGYIDNLRQHCRAMGYGVHVIAYLRSQPAAINSRYCQTVKTWSHNLRVEDFVEQELQSGRHDYAGLFATVLDRPDMKITFRPFTRESLPNGLVADFLEALNIEDRHNAGFTQPRLVNISHGPKTIAAWLLLRRKIAEALPDLTRRQLSPIATPLGKIADELGWNAAPFQGVGTDLHRAILASFSTSNEALAERAWRKSWRDVFAAEEDAVRPLNVFDPAIASAEEREEFEDFIEDAMAFIHLVAAGGTGSEFGGSD